MDQIVAFESKTEKELRIRRANAWIAFWSQRHLLKSNLSLKTRISVFESMVLLA